MSGEDDKVRARDVQELVPEARDPAGLAGRYNTSIAALREATDEITGPSFGNVRRAVRERIQQNKRARRRRVLRVAFPALAAAAAVAIVVAWAVSGSPASEPGPSAPIAEVPAPTDAAAPRTGLVQVDSGAAVAVGARVESDQRPVVVRDEEVAALTVAARSAVRVSEWSAGHSVVVLERGSVHADVSKRQPGESFEVRTPHAVVTVIGTRFDVTRRDALTEVSVDHGRVKVTRPDGSLVAVLGAGERVSVSAQPVTAAAPEPEPVEAIAAADPLLAEAEAPPEVEPAPERTARPEVDRAPRKPKAARTLRSSKPTPRAAEPSLEADPVARARGLLARGKDREAIAILEAAIDAHPSARRLALLGDAYRLSGQRAKAQEIYREALKTASGAVRRVVLADLAGIVSADAALPLWTAYVDEFPGGAAAPKALWAMAQAAERAGDHPQRRRLLERLVTAWPRSPQARKALQALE